MKEFLIEYVGKDVPDRIIYADFWTREGDWFNFYLQAKPRPDIGPTAQFWTQTLDKWLLEATIVATVYKSSVRAIITIRKEEECSTSENSSYEKN